MPTPEREIREFVRTSSRLWGRTADMYHEIVQQALHALDEGTDEFTVLIVRPGGNVRAVFRKEPEPGSNQITQSIVDDPHVVDFPNG